MTRPNSSLSQNVDSALKELRTMSSSNREGRDFQTVSRFGNGQTQQGMVHGADSHGSFRYSGNAQHPVRQPPPGFSPSLPPPAPPPPFNHYLPPPGIPPFHGPPPLPPPPNSPAMLGHPSGSEAMMGHPPGSEGDFTRLPPPFPHHSGRPVQPRHYLPGVAGQSNSAGPSHPNNISQSPAPHGGFRMPGPHATPPGYHHGAPPPHVLCPPSESVRGSHPAYLQGSAAAAPSNNLFRPPLPPPPTSTQHDFGKLVPGGGFPTGQGNFAAPQQTTLEEVEGSSSSSTGAQQEVDSWLKKKGKWTLDVVTTAENGSGKNGAKLGAGSKEKPVTMSIGEAQHGMRGMLHALAAVQAEAQQLKELQATADTATWEASVAKIKQLKEAYLETKEKLDVEQWTNLKKKLDLRRKKRQRQKRQRGEEREAEHQLQFERAQKHAALDQWLEKLQQDDVNQQQMKEMKKTADKTLSKVRREIREARKMLDTISRLQKLRAIRHDTAEKRGQTFPPSVGIHFTKKTEDLMQLITSQVQTFEKEEDALKLILETEKEEAKEKEREEKKRKEREERQRDLEEERESLFGKQEMPHPADPLHPFAQYYMQAQCSLQSLHHIRREWDAFVVEESTPMGSRIPDGWVSPEQPVSLAWVSALQSSNPS